MLPQQPSKLERYVMKLSKYARQNWMLFALSGLFAALAWAGFQDLAATGDWMDSAGLLFVMIGLAGAGAFLIALAVRLWDID